MPTAKNCASCTHWSSSDKKLDNHQQFIGTCGALKQYLHVTTEVRHQAGWSDDAFFAAMKKRLREEAAVLQFASDIPDLKHPAYAAECGAYLRTHATFTCAKWAAKVDAAKEPAQPSLSGAV